MFPIPDCREHSVHPPSSITSQQVDPTTISCAFLLLLLFPVRRCSRWTKCGLKVDYSGRRGLPCLADGAFFALLCRVVSCLLERSFGLEGRLLVSKPYSHFLGKRRGKRPMGSPSVMREGRAPRRKGRCVCSTTKAERRRTTVSSRRMARVACLMKQRVGWSYDATRRRSEGLGL